MTRLVCRTVGASWVAVMAGLLVALAPGLVCGQARSLKSIEQKKAEYQIVRGWFVTAGAGITYAGFGGLESVLAKPEGLSYDGQAAPGFPAQDFTLGKLGSSFSLKGGTILKRKFIIQLGGDWMQYTSSGTFKGEARVSYASFGGSFGYALFNRSGWLLFPFVGYNAGLAVLRVDNYYVDPISFGDITIQRSSSGIYRASLGTAEIGVSTRHSLNKSQTVVLGADLGGYFSAGGEAWKDGKGAVPTDVEKPKLSGAYLRITLGGAWLTTDKPLARRQVIDADEVPGDTAAPAIQDLFKNDKPAEPLDVKQDLKNKPLEKAEPVKKEAVKKEKTKKPTRSKPTKAKKEKTPSTKDYDESEFEKKKN
jgi:hypothetical protein